MFLTRQMRRVDLTATKHLLNSHPQPPSLGLNFFYDYGLRRPNLLSGD
jgi:hypothetical protein